MLGDHYSSSNTNILSLVSEEPSKNTTRVAIGWKTYSKTTFLIERKRSNNAGL